MKNETFTTKAYGASGNIIGGKSLNPIEVERRSEGEDEVCIEVLYCGVCHSDIHQVANDWSNTIYPCVPGHEIIGKVKSVGSRVTRFSVGDIVGVGCMIDSCKDCESCRTGEEQFCRGPVGMTMTYNGHWKPDGSKFNTFGGYSSHVIANERFVLKIPNGLDFSRAAPILCAGVTTYGPLKRAKVKGLNVGIIGVGGLGHMAIKIAKAMGAKVTAITSNEEKGAESISVGAEQVVIWSNKEELKKNEFSFDFILCTIPYTFDINDFVPLLRSHGSFVTVGLLGPYEKPVNNMEVAKYDLSIGGSMIGSVAETQEVLEFCGSHGILPEVQLIKMSEINEAFENVKNESVRFRYVIDMKTL